MNRTRLHKIKQTFLLSVYVVLSLARSFAEHGMWGGLSSVASGENKGKGLGQGRAIAVTVTNLSPGPCSLVGMLVALAALKMPSFAILS